MRIGTVEINSQLALAPMAGVTDAAFRELCASLGAGLTCTELVSSKALCYQDKKSRGLLKLAPNERPAAAQIFGSDIPCMAEDLGGGGLFVGCQLQKAATFLILIAQRLGADQLRAAHTGAQLAAYPAEGHVGDAGHRRQIQLGVDLYVSDVHERLLCVYCVSAGYFTTKNFC